MIILKYLQLLILKKKEPLIPTMWNVKNLVKRIFDEDKEEKKFTDELDAREEANELVTDDNRNGHQEGLSKRKSMDEFIAEKNQTVGTENSLKPERKSI